jgi:Ca2+-binding RTX toxin-like protein
MRSSLMANKTIKGFHDTNFVVKTSHTTLTVDVGAMLMSGKVDPSSSPPEATVMEDFSKMPTPSHNTFNINGEIIGYEIGLLAGGATDKIAIGKTGEIEAAVAVYAAGANTHIENRGHLVTTGFDSGVGTIVSMGDHSHVQNDGLIEGLSGIGTSGAGVAVVNGEHGIIRSVVSAVTMQTDMGDTSTFVNHGTVVVTAINIGSDTFAYESSAGNETVTNDGSITGNVSLGDGDDKLTNPGMIDGYVDLGDGTNALDNHGGTITGSIIGGAGNDKIVNSGKIMGDVELGDATNVFDNHGGTMTGASIVGGTDNDKVINSGKMTSDVDLGAGDDTFDGRGGHMIGSIIGGDDNDTLITDSAKLVLSEESAGGNDTVKSTVSYTLTANVENLALIGKANINGTGMDMAADTIAGNIGNNTLMGLSGSDDLSGGKGNDILWGGADADTFHFATGYGHDTLADFSQTDMDKIDLSHWTGMTNLAAVTNHAVDQGSDTLITLGQDTLLIKNIHEAQLTDGDFVYSAT